MKPSDYSPVTPRSLPYLDLQALGGRPVPVHSYFDGDDWHLWVRASEPGLLQPLQTAGVVEGEYLAAVPVAPSDLHSLFFEFFDKRTALPNAQPFLTALRNDLFNIAASLAKLQLIADAKRERAWRLALTEVEYLVIVCRSVFDLIQEVVHRFWKAIRLVGGKVKEDIPQTFAKVVLHGGTPRTAHEIRDYFGLSDALSHWYEVHTAFFICLRQSRDFIIHSPRADDIIFETDSGFQVSSRDGMFSQCVRWHSAALGPNALGPLNFALSEWVTSTLKAIETLPTAIAAQITPLPDYAPATRLYLRSPDLGAFLSVKRIVTDDPWGRFNGNESNV